MERTEAIIHFIETLRVPDGTMAGQLIKLSPEEKQWIKAVYSRDELDERIVNQAILTMARKNGKGLALDTPIPTPHGWKSMGELVDGDEIFSDSGEICHVVHAHDPRLLDCYRLTFSDGTSVVADGDHKWGVYSRHLKKYGGYIVMDTRDMYGNEQILRSDGNLESRYRLPVAGQLKYEEKCLSIAPYVLGAWLGDGTSRGPQITNADEEVFTQLVANGEPVSFKEDCGDLAITANVGVYAGPGIPKLHQARLKTRLRELDLLQNKHIPDEYLQSSVGQRMELLRGLMDTDGYVSKAGQCEFVSVNKRLFDGTVELIRSLGYKPTMKFDRSQLNGVDCGPRYRVQFWAFSDEPVFHVERKRARLKENPGKSTRSQTRHITSIEAVPTVPTRCITVDSPTSLFLAGEGMVPTHNTVFIACLVICHLCGPEAVRNGQLYSVAFDREQAGIVFKMAAAMIRMDEELSDQLKIIDSRKTIDDPVSGSEFVSLSAEARSKHGKSSSFLVFDELAQFGADRELYDVMTTSTGAHGREALTWVISTQAPDDLSLLSELVDYGRKVEGGEIENSTVRCFYYAVEDDDDPWDEENWKKANPHLGSFRSLEEMRITAEKAKKIPSAEVAFRNLYLNQRINASDYFLTPDAWRKCGGEFDVDKFHGEQCWLGIDLSSKNDLTALVAIIPKELDEKTHYYVLPYFFVPGDGLAEKEDRDKVPYRAWESQQLIEAKPGRTIDYRWVAKKIIEISQTYELVNIGFDRWRIDDLTRELDDLGYDFEMTPVGQGFKDMNPCVENLEDVVAEEVLHHGDHPVMTWNIANTVIQRDPAGSRKFAKNKSRGRIDGTVALAMAVRTCMADLELGSVYDNDHELVVL